MNSNINKLKNLFPKLDNKINLFGKFNESSIRKITKRAFNSSLIKINLNLDKNKSENENYTERQNTLIVKPLFRKKFKYSFIKVNKSIILLTIIIYYKILVSFCSTLKSRKQDIIQHKKTESKIKDNIAQKKEDIEEKIIENLKFKRSVFTIYLVLLGSVFLYSIFDYIKYPLGSKEATDAYFTMINSLNCANALGVIINLKTI